MELPSQEDYPDYYEKIGRPISLTMIRESIANGSYDGDENKTAFKKDLLEMFENAFTYNVEGSLVWEDAYVMKEFFLQEYRESLEAASNTEWTHDLKNYLQ